MAITREQLTSALSAALQPLPWVYALWEGGSASFDRLDQWSDLDLMIDCEPERVDDAFSTVEEILGTLSGGDRPGAPAIALRYRLPSPTWHGHEQCFYQLRDAGPWLMLDLVVMKHDQGQRFSEVEQHGRPVIYFDKTGSVKVSSLDWPEHVRLLQRRVESIGESFMLFQPLVQKEFLRGDALNAFSFFQGLTLRPLVELLRIIHDPARHSFHLRYAQHCLPPAISQRLQSLCFVSSPAELESRHSEAMQWYADLFAEARQVVIQLAQQHGVSQSPSQ